MRPLRLLSSFVALWLAATGGLVSLHDPLVFSPNERGVCSETRFTPGGSCRTYVARGALNTFIGIHHVQKRTRPTTSARVRMLPLRGLIRAHRAVRTHTPLRSQQYAHAPPA